MKNVANTAIVAMQCNDVPDRGYMVSDTVERLGVSAHRLYKMQNVKICAGVHAVSNALAEKVKSRLSFDSERLLSRPFEPYRSARARWKVLATRNPRRSRRRIRRTRTRDMGLRRYCG